MSTQSQKQEAPSAEQLKKWSWTLGNLEGMLRRIRTAPAPRWLEEAEARREEQKIAAFLEHLIDVARWLRRTGSSEFERAQFGAEYHAAVTWFFDFFGDREPTNKL